MLRDPALIPLSHQHQHALALCLLTEKAFVADPNNLHAADQARQIVEQFDGEMRAHFEVEEQMLFPMLRPFPNLSNLVAELIAEHQRITAMVDELRLASSRDMMLAFAGLLRRHVRKEESELFEQAQRLLSREQLDRIAEHF
jgi:hemerythrin-like domain-containing protein